MEVSAASVSSTASLPRLRVSRNSRASPSSRSQAGGDQEQISPFQFKNPPSYPDSQTSEDEFGIDAFGTRLLSASLPPLDSSAPTSDTTHRLKALIERFDNSSRTSIATNKTNLPPSPSEPDSDVDLHSAQAARASIRSLLQDALREPGDTPQKSRIKRRASFNVSDSPKVDKARRKSTSDDDPEIIKQKDQASASSVLPLDRLRHQFTQSMHPPDAQSTSSRRSETTDSTPKRPLHSRSSKIPVHHSPITHAKSHKDLEPFESLKDDDSEANLRHRIPDTPSPSSDHSERNAFERVKPGSWPAPPPPSSGPRGLGPSRQSLANGKFDEDRLSLDGRSSRTDSIIHNAEYKERLSEARNEQQHELERSWNRPSSRHSLFKNDVPEKAHSHLHSQDHASFSKIHINGYSHSQTHLHDRHRAYEHDTPARAVSPAPGHSGSSSLSSIKVSKHEDNITLTADPIKRHRRTTTELSEPMGAYPKQIGVTSVFVPNHSDGSLFGDESILPPRMSTPPFKNSDISDLTISPVPSDIPLPLSPPSAPNPRHDPVTKADADFARLQKAIGPNFNIPPQQSSPVSWSQNPYHEEAQNSETMQLSHSKKSSPINTLGSVTSSSPPRDKEGWQTPSKRGSDDELPAKTPHPPGAFCTPAHVADKMKRSDHELRRGPINRPDNTTLNQTPVLPGAYVSTPATSKLRGILKVRFDSDRKDVQDSQASNVPDLQEAKGISTPPSPSSGEVPLDLSPSRRHKLRIVDEYGRTRKFTENGEEIFLDRKTSQHASGVDETTLTPRRRAKMRQVDAFGKEIVANQLQVKEETKIDEPTEKEAKPQRKKQGISQMARSLGELQQEMVQEENALSVAFPSGIPDKGRLVSLATVSKTARTEREKLSQQLQRERDAEGVLANKLFVARNLQRLPGPQVSERSWWVRKWRLAMIIIFLEVVLLFMGYKLALVHAKHIWLKTYFDPFFPALYLHKSRPSFLTHLGSLPLDWSVFAISRKVSSFSVSSFIIGMGRTVWEWTPDPAAASMVPQAWPS